MIHRTTQGEFACDKQPGDRPGGRALPTRGRLCP
jgi:hypothetical protein